jgi:hypothetical protein
VGHVTFDSPNVSPITGNVTLNAFDVTLPSPFASLLPSKWQSFAIDVSVYTFDDALAASSVTVGASKVT